MVLQAIRAKQDPRPITFHRRYGQVTGLAVTRDRQPRPDSCRSQTRSPTATIAPARIRSHHVVATGVFAHHWLAGAIVTACRQAVMPWPSMTTRTPTLNVGTRSVISGTAHGTSHDPYRALGRHRRRNGQRRKWPLLTAALDRPVSRSATATRKNSLRFRAGDRS